MRTAICTCIKDEQPYLKEWVDWHLALGFSHIYLFEDDGSKPHIDIVKDYNNITLLPMSIVRNEIITKEGRQMLSVTYSLKHFTLYDWLAFIDTDEFIDFEEGYNLDKLLREYSESPAIILSWMLYSANERIEKPECGVIEAYPNPDLKADYKKVWFGPLWSVKSLANMKFNPKFENIHTAIDAINMNGNNFPEYKVFKKAWIRHYYTKSWEEWVWRIMDRGDLCNGNRKLAQFFNANPDMLPMKEALIKSVAHRIPHGNKNYLLDDENMIIAGGNIHEIMEMNQKLKSI